MECMAPEKCELSLRKTDDFVFHQKLDNEVLTGGGIDLTRGPLAGQNPNRSGLYSIIWMHKRAAWVDLGPQGSAGSQSDLRATSVLCENECFLCFRNWLATEGALI